MSSGGETAGVSTTTAPANCDIQPSPAAARRSPQGSTTMRKVIQ
jgi:hypothetical protein